MLERNLAERYRLEGRIGEGGMAVVYAGMDTVLRRRVAIKVLRPQLAADADFVARFYTEAQHAAKLSHPNIVNIYDVGREGDSYFIVMELVDGATLAEMIESDGRLPEPVAIDFAAQICNGLAYAHRQGLLHRDVKPANILVTKDDVVKISDFGIARAVTTQTMTMTQPGMVMGSVFYISPEQAQGHELHETSDLYSFGIVLYQMLTGRLPYTGESPITVALKHVSSPVPAVDADDASVSPALAAIVRRLMEKNPADRFDSAVAVAKALREAREQPLAGPPTAAPSRGPAPIPRPKPRPSPLPDRSAPKHAAVDDTEVRPASPIARVFAGVGIVVALLMAIVAGYIVASRPGSFAARESRVPSVVGERVSDAQAQLDRLGLRSTVVMVSSDSIPADRVVREDPVAATGVESHTVVQLYVSSGLPTVQLIDIRQYSSDDAERYLRNAKLVPKIVRRYDTSTSGTVLEQKPAPGTTVAIHSIVALVVSQGAAPVAVPDIVSESVSDATAELKSRHLRLVVSERDPNDQIPMDTITTQSPQPGATVSPESSVEVVVSSGPPAVLVPEVEGRIVSDALAALHALGLEVGVEYVVDQAAAQGTVMKQSVENGTSLKKGAAITLDVAVPGIVPDVAGKSALEAQTALENAGYKVGNTSYVQEGPDGTVARTEPLAGVALRPGETVMLYVNGVSKEGQ
jgi:serine/threonine-protein kinase